VSTPSTQFPVKKPKEKQLLFHLYLFLPHSSIAVEAAAHEPGVAAPSCHYVHGMHV
jgi:hypothetical protein